MKYQRIEKGSVVLARGWFYVIVHALVTETDLELFCICDNANNIYNFNLSDLIKEKCLFISPKDAVEVSEFNHLLDDSDLEKMNASDRTIPVKVIAEVLVGIHDERFDHWVEGK